MSKLYIANVTKQIQVVCYRLDYGKNGELLDEVRRFRPANQQDIPPGRQVQIGSDFHMNQITDIVDQLGRYGLISVEDVKNGRFGRKVAPYVFNIDMPVPADVLRRVKSQNDVLQIEDGKLRRQRAAVATSDLVQNTVAHQFAEAGIDADPSERQSIAFEQEEQTEAGEKTIAEGYRVDKNAPQAPSPRPPKRSQRRAAA